MVLINLLVGGGIADDCPTGLLLLLDILDPVLCLWPTNIQTHKWHDYEWNTQNQTQKWCVNTRVRLDNSQFMFYNVTSKIHWMFGCLRYNSLLMRKVWVSKINSGSQNSFAEIKIFLKFITSSGYYFHFHQGCRVPFAVTCPSRTIEWSRNTMQCTCKKSWPVSEKWEQQSSQQLIHANIPVKVFPLICSFIWLSAML